MRRDAALVGLSHDHHRALVTAQMLRRASDETSADALAAFAAFWVAGERHFEIEEEVLLPAFAPYGNSRDPLIRRMLADHVELRGRARHVLDPNQTVEVGALRVLGERLAEHVRLEEREIFPLIEAAMPPDALALLALDLRTAERVDPQSLDPEVGG